MGSFYVNITAKTTAKEAVNFLESKRLSAYVMPTGEQQCVIYEEQCDTQDIAHMYELLVALTAEQDCSTLGVLNHDDDMLFLMLCSKGEFKADYTWGISFEEMYAEYDDEGVPVDWSEETEEEKDIKEAGKKEQVSIMAKALSEAFTVADTQAILEVLTQDFVFANEIHVSLAEILDLPECSVGLGYNYIAHMQPEEKSHYNLDSIQLVETTNTHDE